MFPVDGRAPRARAMGLVCTLFGLAAMMIAPRVRSAPTDAAAPTAAPTSAAEAAAAKPRAPESPAWIESENATAKAFVYPPQSQSEKAKPVTVLLHGMCGHPQSACRPFVDVATSRSWLVCPRGEDACGGGSRWNYRDDEATVEASVRALAAAHAGEVDTKSPRILVGFSLGGIVAVRLAQDGTGRYAGLVVIASQVHPDAAALKKAGVKRAVMVAGDLDMTRTDMERDARAMDAAGLPTRFVSLGHFGHGYPADMEQRMREPMQWVAAGS